jgi:hypothetical protein
MVCLNHLPQDGFHQKISLMNVLSIIKVHLANLLMQNRSHVIADWSLCGVR